MINKTLWVLEHLFYGAAILTILLLPAIISLLYKVWALKGRRALDPAEYRKIENWEFGIFVGGYLILIVTCLFLVAPN